MDLFTGTREHDAHTTHGKSNVVLRKQRTFVGSYVFIVRANNTRVQEFRHEGFSIISVRSCLALGV